MSLRKRRSTQPAGGGTTPKLKSSKSVKDEETLDTMIDVEYVQMFTDNLQRVRISLRSILVVF